MKILTYILILAGSAVTAVGFILDNDVLTLAGVTVIVLTLFTFLYSKKLLRK